MSHCLILQQYKDFYIGSDSAGSIFIDGKFYRTSNDMKKIFTFGQDVYFCSGIDNIVDECNIWINSNCQNNIDVCKLQIYLKSQYSQKKYQNCFDIELLICRIEDNISKVYHLAQYNNFNIEEYKGVEGKINILCGGCKTQDGFNKAKEIISCKNVNYIYKNVFASIHDERIGGTLTVYHNYDQIYSNQIDNIIINTHLVLADALVGGYVEGSEIHGGSLEISGNGGIFKVNEDGTVQISSTSGTNKYVPKEEYDITIGHIEAQKMHRVQVICDNKNIFTRKNQTATLTCKVYSWDSDITNTIHSSRFDWIRVSDDAASDADWNSLAIHKGRKSLTISTEDVQNNASFSCQVDIPD